MSKEKNPTGLKIKADIPDGIKKLNNRPMYLVTIVASIVVGSVLYSINSKGEKPKEEENTSIRIEANKDNKDIENMFKATTPLVETNTTSNLGSPLQPRFDKNVTMTAPLSPLDQAAQEEYAAELKRNVDAKLAPTTTKDIQQNNQNTQTIPTTADIASLLQNQAVAGKNAVSDLLASNVQNQKDINEKSADFMSSTKTSVNYLPYKKTPQQTKYELKTGSVIPGIMISGVNSELPGMIIGQVSNNVYDSATGHYLLIPQGSRLVGQYSADTQYGQSRVLVAWNRIIFPDGKALNIEAMNGTDQAGYAGFADKVNNHYLRIFGSATLLSVLGGDISFSAGKISINRQQSNSLLGDSSVGSISSKMLEKNLEIAPTITIRPGYQFNIFVTKDMQLEPLSRLQ